jgi:GNAT superfamily N-acetyltransferase
MHATAEQLALKDIQARRRSRTPCDGPELQRRIQQLGDMSLDAKKRHLAFREIYDALTPPGFQLMPLPNHSEIVVSPCQIKVAGILVDAKIERQVAGQISRHFLLDQRFVHHKLLQVQDVYRGGGFSHVLLYRALPFYRRIGLFSVLIHAAMETGRWHWARMGFEFERSSRPSMEAYAALGLFAAEQEPLASGFPAHELATMGSEPGGICISLKELRDRLAHAVTSLTADAARRAAVVSIVAHCERRIRHESDARWRWLAPSRFEALAAQHKLSYDEEIPLGKAIMLAGPDWHGVFDLTDRVAQQVFEAEFNREIAERAQRAAQT